MRPALKKIVSASLLIVCGLAMQSCSARDEKEALQSETKAKATDEKGVSAINAQCGDDSLPPEVKALIGKKLPPKVSGMKQAEIPKFIDVGGALLVDSGEAVTTVLAYSEGVFAGKWTVFFMERTYQPSQEKEILDARMLPANLLDWRLKNDIPEGNSGQYKLSGRCRINDKDERVILGLVRPERGKSDCAHFSKRIKQAWQMDMKLGCLIPIATKDLQCEYITMNDCY